MKKKSYKLAKLERERYSLFTDDLDTCIVCKMKATDMNEIFRGRNRQNSMKYGLCIPMCRRCHSILTDNFELENEWKIKGQKMFMEHYNKTTQEFIDIFKMNYL